MFVFLRLSYILASGSHMSLFLFQFCYDSVLDHGPEFVAEALHGRLLENTSSNIVSETRHTLQGSARGLLPHGICLISSSCRV